MKCSRKWFYLSLVFLWSLSCSVQVFAESKGDFSCLHEHHISCIGAMLGSLHRDKKDGVIATELILKNIMKNNELKDVKIIPMPAVESLVDALKAKQIDSVILDPLSYLQVEQYINPEVRFTAILENNGLYRCHILTLKSDAITDLRQLKGKKLALAKEDIFGKVILKIELAKAGIYDIDSFFAKIYEADNGVSAVNDLLFEKADVVVSSNIAFETAKQLNYQIKQRTNIFRTSKQYVRFISGAHKDVPNKYLINIDSSIEQTQKNQKYKKLLSIVNIKSIIKVTDKHIDDIRRLETEYQRCVIERSPSCVTVQN